MVLFCASLQRMEDCRVAGTLDSGPAWLPQKVPMGAWAPHYPSLGLSFLTVEGKPREGVRPAGDNQQEGVTSCANGGMLRPGVSTYLPTAHRGPV